jgi:hypothetical protein
MSDPARDFVEGAAARALAPGTAPALVGQLAAAVRRAEAVWDSRPRAEAEVVLSLLRADDPDPARLNACLAELERLGRLPGFLRLAQPRNSSDLLPWLVARGMDRGLLIRHYEWGLTDSLDVFFGLLLGVAGSVVEDLKGLLDLGLDAAKAAARNPDVAARIALLLTGPGGAALHAAGLQSAVRTALTEGATAAPGAYFQAVFGVAAPALSLSGAIDAIGQKASEWSAELDRLLGQLEFFKVGIHLGRALGLILGLAEAGVGLAKLFPALARRGRALAAALPAKIAALPARADPAAAARLVREARAVDAASALPDLRRLPDGVTAEDLARAVRSGALQETPNGRRALWIPCSL